MQELFSENAGVLHILTKLLKIFSTQCEFCSSRKSYQPIIHTLQAPLYEGNSTQIQNLLKICFGVFHVFVRSTK